MTSIDTASRRACVVIDGAGFGGLAAAKRSAQAPFDVTAVDRYNHRLFQPPLYQVATHAECVPVLEKSVGNR